MEIHWHKPDSVGEDDRERTEGRLRRLEAEREGDLVDLWIDIEASTHHRHGHAEAVIRCQARDADLVSRRKADEPGIALREALEAFEREVHALREQRAEPMDVRVGGPSRLGIVDRVHRERDFGFLLTDGGEQVYFHRNALRSELDWGALQEGDRVALEVEGGEKGLQATVVAPPPPGAPGP